VAIKVLRSSLPSALDQARFLNEQRILARLRHPHIATLLDVGVVDDRPHMVLERIDGARSTSGAAAGGRPISPRVLDALDAVIGCLVGGARAPGHPPRHQAGNVLVDDDGHVKLIDFGIAKLLDDIAPACGPSGPPPPARR
jgi:eukaryotic-like serine/threonine-protein kinase